MTKVNNQSARLPINCKLLNQKIQKIKNPSNNPTCKTLSKSAHTSNNNSSTRVSSNSQTPTK